MALIQANPVYQQALATVQNDPAAIEALGQPIEQLQFGPIPVMQGQVNDSGDTGTADVFFSVAGPNGQAEVHAVGSKANGAWQTETISVTLPSGELLDLSPQPSGEMPPVFPTVPSF
jgi:hypothetical protein